MFKLVATAEADVTGSGVIIRAKLATQINSAACGALRQTLKTDPR